MYKKFANAKRAKGPKVKTDGWVMLNAKNLKFKHGIKKLSPKFVGPFLVVKEINKVAFKLKLPNNWKVHPVFHRSLLRPFIGDVPSNLSHPLVEPGHKYEVEQILRSRIVRGKTQYLVKWKNYAIEEATWQTEADCENCKDLVKIFETKDKTLGGNVMNHIHDAGKVFPLFCSFSMERRLDTATGKIKVYVKAALKT